MALSSTTQVIFDTEVASLATLGQWLVDNGYGTAGGGGGSYTSPLTTNGDIFIRAGGADSRLGIGSANAVLTSTGTAPQWTASTTLGAMTDSWTDSGTNYVAIGLDISDTASGSDSLIMRLRRGGSNMFTIGKDGGIFSNAGLTVQTGGFVGGGEIRVRSDGCFAIGDTSQYNVAAPKDTSLFRTAAGVWGLRGSSLTVGGALDFLEIGTTPTAQTDRVILYAKDNGSGKTQLMALFPTGAAQQVAIEP